MIGPVILDLLDKELSPEEKELLQHPLVGGVILFTRNYDSIEQINALCKAIRSARKSPILITVDHEGGRVQRFREGFTQIPSMGKLGDFYQNNPEKALNLAETCGWLLATELLAVGIDLSFAPVLDLNKGICPAIGDRAFHQNPKIVATMAEAVRRGMKLAGMASIGKHFPGHGSVNLDSHYDLPIDPRPLSQIEAEDLIPFQEMIRDNMPAMMPAHIIFSAVDDKPVGFSRIWLEDLLRQKYHFKGVIISDDLNMKGASTASRFSDRAMEAFNAGCDLVLICNNRAGAIEALDTLPRKHFLGEEKFQLLQGKFNYTHQTLRNSPLWQQQSERLKGHL